MSKIWKTIFWVTVFAITMAYMESAIVVYLRAIYYPGGFNFPLQPIDGYIGITEIIREAITILMLISIASLAGKTALERFAYFLFSFALWDIFYYVFLKLLINWPDSLLTNDILFLIPLVWVGPVIAPLINSLIMIILAFVIIYFLQKNGYAKIRLAEWIMLIIGSIITIISYVEDYTEFLLQRFSFIELFFSANRPEIMKMTTNYMPGDFCWWIFLIGQLFFLGAVTLFIRKNSLKAT